LERDQILKGGSAAEQSVFAASPLTVSLLSGSLRRTGAVVCVVG